MDRRRRPCDNQGVTRLRLPWLLALPLMAAGSVAAHTAGRALGPAVSSSELAHRDGGELARLHERASHGYAGHTVLWLGLVAALVFFAGIYALVVRFGGRRGRGLGAGCFFLLPLMAYSSQELSERLLHAESFPFHAVFEPRFLLGLALQLPFAAAAFALGWLLLRAGKRLVELLGARPVPKPRALPARIRTPSTSTAPRVRALSRGHPLRGPPLLA